MGKCHGLNMINNKKEDIVCKIAKLTEEFDYLCELEWLIQNKQV
jgi:hypothetical protein